MTYLERANELAILIRENSVLTGDFVLASGTSSNIYLDCRKVLLTPRGLRLASDLVAELVQDSIKNIDSVGGMAAGAIPLVSGSLLSLERFKPSIRGFFVRKEPKSYGTQKSLEGSFRPGDRVLLLEDVVTTGKSLESCVDVVTRMGGIVEKVISLVDRSDPSGSVRRKFDKFESVLSIADILKTV